MTDNTATIDRQMRQYYLMWSGQTLSIMASGITNFALGIWILNQTQSVTEFAMVFVITVLPGILLAPFIGALIDRHSRKAIIMLADCAAAMTTVIIAWLYFTDSLSIWHIYIIAAIDSVALAFHMPASWAAVTLLVPREKMGKVAGMGQITGSLATIGGPLLAGLLLTFMDLSGILIIDLVSFIFAMGVMIFVKIPEPEKAQVSKGEKQPSLLTEAKFGWHYIKERKGLVYLLSYFSVSNLIGGMVLVLMIPMVKHFASEPQLGTIMAMGGLGGLLGGIAFAKTGGPQRKVNGVIAGGLCSGLCIMGMGLQPSIILVGVAFFLFNLTLPVINGSSQVIWQTKVEPAVQGRVFATRQMLAQITLPIGALSAGPLADKVFEPLMADGGVLANSVGHLLGAGPGRGVALLLVLAAVFPMVFAAFAYSNKRIANMEDDLPDALPAV